MRFVYCLFVVYYVVVVLIVRLQRRLVTTLSLLSARSPEVLMGEPYMYIYVYGQRVKKGQSIGGKPCRPRLVDDTVTTTNTSEPSP